MSFIIDAIGTAVPHYSITQSDAAEFAATCCEDSRSNKRIVSSLFHRAGIDSRHSVILESAADDESYCQNFYPPSNGEMDQGPTTSQRMEVFETASAELAIAATRNALAQSCTQRADISHLVTVSCSGFQAPGFDIALIRELGLSPNVSRTHIGFMGCHGALNGLRVAHAFADANPDARILLCTVELCSLHYQYGMTANKIVSNSLFADGSAALVGGTKLETSVDKWHLAASGSTVFSETEDMMRWSIGDHGFKMELSAQVPETIGQLLRPCLEGWLAEQKLSLADVGSWAIHPGGPRILDACASALGLLDKDLKVSRSVLANYGNMSSPTILFIINELHNQNSQLPCVTMAFGPGLTVETALFR